MDIGCEAEAGVENKKDQCQWASNSRFLDCNQAFEARQISEAHCEIFPANPSQAECKSDIKSTCPGVKAFRTIWFKLRTQSWTNDSRATVERIGRFRESRASRSLKSSAAAGRATEIEILGAL